MFPPEYASPAEENRHHHYSGNQIPWYVRAMWIAFWCLAVYYTIRFLFPDLQSELISPP